MPVTGIDALESALRALQNEARTGLESMAHAMGAVGERAIKLELSLSSHPAGTRTPSRPYADPPSLISGRLRSSVRETRSYASGDDAWTVHVAPTTVYARIQELGGVTGDEYRTHLPPRPYVRPAIARSELAARDAAIRVFRDETGI